MSMDRGEMIMRAGFYVGLAANQLGDDTYAKRWLGHAEDMTEADFVAMAREIHARLVDALKIPVDYDPFEDFQRGVIICEVRLP